MSAAELKAGPGNSNPPAAGPWTVLAAKNEGVTPGFRIRDAAGRQYLIKFDPLSNPELASAILIYQRLQQTWQGFSVPLRVDDALDFLGIHHTCQQQRFVLPDEALNALPQLGAPGRPIGDERNATA